MRASSVFIDTGAWFAVQVADDAHPEIAGDTLAKLPGDGRSLVTSNLVIGETYTLLRVSKGYREAKRFLDLLAQSRRIDRLFITEFLVRLLSA